MAIRKKGEISFLTFSIFENLPVKAAVSCRTGGVSQPPFDSLNMGLHVGDEAKDVLENRRRYGEALGISADSLINCCQVHGTHIEEVSAKDCGRGALSLASAIPGTDGLATAEPLVPLTMNYADCTPLFFYDPLRKVSVLAHGGWRGTAGNIAGKAVRFMEAHYHSESQNILAAIGPAIGFSDFEVGNDVVEEMKTLFDEREFSFLFRKKEGDKYLFNLPEANHRLMRKAGIREEHIEDCHISTWERKDLFYSYRREKGRTGRHMAVLMMESE